MHRYAQHRAQTSASQVAEKESSTPVVALTMHIKSLFASGKLMEEREEHQWLSKLVVAYAMISADILKGDHDVSELEETRRQLLDLYATTKGPFTAEGTTSSPSKVTIHGITANILNDLEDVLGPSASAIDFIMDDESDNGGRVKALESALEAVDLDNPDDSFTASSSSVVEDDASGLEEDDWFREGCSFASYGNPLTDVEDAPGSSDEGHSFFEGVSFESTDEKVDEASDHVTNEAATVSSRGPHGAVPIEDDKDIWSSVRPAQSMMPMPPPFGRVTVPRTSGDNAQLDYLASIFAPPVASTPSSAPTRDVPVKAIPVASTLAESTRPRLVMTGPRSLATMELLISEGPLTAARVLAIFEHIRRRTD